MSEYDAIAERYIENTNKRVTKKFCLLPTFLNVLGDVKEKHVLDIGTGYGYLARILKGRGAQVVGVDLSEQMIKRAKEANDGITYHVGKLGELGKKGDFDAVTGFFILHYAKTREELLAMCKDVALNLKPGGELILLNNNPDGPLINAKKYEIIATAEEPLHDGSAITDTLCPGEETECTFTTYHWSKTTYEEVLTQAGLTNISWHKLTVSEEIKNQFEEGFWDDLLEKPYLTIIKAQKHN